MRPSRAGAGLMITDAAALAVLAAGCASSAGRAASSAPSAASSAVTTRHANDPAGAIQFPPTLFGFRQDASAQAQKLDQNMAQTLAMIGMFAHPRLALYGSMDTGDMFIVGVTDLTTAAQSRASERRRGANPSEKEYRANSCCSTTAVRRRWACSPIHKLPCTGRWTPAACSSSASPS